VPESQKICLDVNQLECIIAAILASTSTGEGAESVAKRYADIYTHLQAIGDVVVQKLPA
jgi:hypothetical protein